MSLLTRGTETVKVFQEVQAVEYDSDGNRVSRPALVGTACRARIAPISATENQDGGYNTESRYRLVLVGWQGAILGAQSQIEWNGKRWSIQGDAMIHNGSPRTRHVTYTIVRK